MNASVFRGRPAGEVAVVGLGKSGRSVSELLARDGHTVYASDAGTGDAARANGETLAALGAVAVLLKSEFLLLIVGGVFVAETVSVILQRSVFKYRRLRYGVEFAQQNRLFRRAPLHHHFEVKGWPETQVVVRFWILGIFCAILALSTLKLR